MLTKLNQQLLKKLDHAHQQSLAPSEIDKGPAFSSLKNIYKNGMDQISLENMASESKLKPIPPLNEAEQDFQPKNLHKKSESALKSNT